MAYILDVYSLIGTTYISFEDFCEYHKIEPGTSVYNSLKSAYAARDAEGFNQIVDYYQFKEYLTSVENKYDVQKAINKANAKYKSYPQIKQAIADWLAEPGVGSIKSIDGTTIDYFYNHKAKAPNGITPGEQYWDGINGNIAISADVVDNSLVLQSDLPVGETGTSITGYMGTITSALGAVATAGALAKNIRGAFYTNVKDFWGLDMYQFDPAWWDAQYAGDNLTGFRAFVARELLAVDTIDNTYSMYIDDDFAAGVAAYLNSKGWFDESEIVYTDPEGAVSVENLKYPIHAYSQVEAMYEYKAFPPSTVIVSKVDTVETQKIYSQGSGKIVLVKSFTKVLPEATENYIPWYVSKVDDTDIVGKEIYVETRKYYDYQFAPVEYQKTEVGVFESSKISTTVNGKPVFCARIATNTYYLGERGYDIVNKNWDDMYVSVCDTRSQELDTIPRAAYIALYGNEVNGTVVDGVEDEPDGKRFFTTSRNLKPDAIKFLLKASFPELWANSITRGIPQQDGSIKRKTYIRVPIPNGTNLTDKNPTTGTGVQGKNTTNVNDLPSGSQSILPSTSTRPNANTPTSDRTDTGTAPAAPAPVGNASSMWAIYNPSQSEVDNFGAWMWSSNIFEQIKKLFSDPMQAIIGIHKVFGTPIVGGRKNIKVGYLDSGIESNYVSNQYTTVDCGTVNLNEYFGCVYDYAPFTSVNLYLPFVGVVQLDTADVMRSSINVTYGIDVLTGDCLAKISVMRDEVGGILYSYPGNCAVKYPVSSGSYLGILGFAAGAIGAFATGNPGLLAAGASGGYFNVQHSGSFGGNTGATGPKTPYLIVSRPQPAYASNFNSIEGYPVNSTIQIGLCQGFIRVKECHLSGINATDDELDMIDQILKDGIIVQS